MVIMALDHVRDYFHAAALQFQPDDLTRTTVAIFLTRWITHFCAPTFAFSAGAAAYLRFQRGLAANEMSAFLWTRGLWLVVLEVTVLRFGYNFSYFTGPLILTILWALGGSMIALGFLIRLPFRWTAALSVLTILLHNLTDPITPASFGGAGWIWTVLHQPGAIPIGAMMVIVGYPLLPWIAVMAAGYSFGRILDFDDERRQRWLVRLGAGLTAAFVVVRALNAYGDPRPWSMQPPGLAILSFLRCTKYPPSLDFLLMTLGPAILVLAGLYRLRVTRTNPLAVIGRVPLFYFLGHIFLLHALTIPLAYFRYGGASFLFNPLPSAGGPVGAFPADYGYDLWVVYLVWAVVVALMYPACKWFAGVKERNRSWWLAYL